MRIPESSHPLVDPNTGLINKVWYQVLAPMIQKVAGSVAGSAGTMPGNFTATPGADVRHTSIEVKSWLALAAADVSGLATVATSNNNDDLTNKFLPAAGSDYRANTTGRLAMTPNTVWDAAAVVGLTDAATIAVDMSAGFNFSVSIAGNRTLDNPTNPKVGQSGVFKVTASGAVRTITLGVNYFSTTTFPVTIASGTICYISYWVESATRIIVMGVVNNPT